MSSLASTAGLRCIASVLVKMYLYKLQIFIDSTFYRTIWAGTAIVFMVTFCNVPFLVTFGLTFPPSVATIVSDPCLMSV